MSYSFPERANDQATVSVVIPVYNSCATAVLAIESVLSQTYPCTEIIVVDDGSSDNSASMIRDYFLNKSNIVHIYTIKNAGAAGARNFGISKARSFWIAFLDSDDKWMNDKVASQMTQLIKDRSIGLIGALTNSKSYNANFFQFKNRLQTITCQMLLFKNYFQTSTVILRREIIEELGGFPKAQRYAEEGDLFMRVAAKYKCVLLSKVMVDYSSGKRGFGSSGLSANLLQMELGELRNIWRAKLRGDNGIFVTSAAIAYSIAKFSRRVLFQAYFNFFHHH